MEVYIRPRLSHSNSLGNDAEKDTAGCRAFNRKYIVIERNENMSATSIGLPKLKIAFEKAAQATANRAKKGYVGMIVRDAKAQGLHKLVSDTMIPTELGVDNRPW